MFHYAINHYKDARRFCRVENAVSSAVHRRLAVDLNRILGDRDYPFDTLCPTITRQSIHGKVISLLGIQCGRRNA